MALEQAGKALEFAVPVFLPRSATMARALSDMMICDAPKAEAPSTLTA